MKLIDFRKSFRSQLEALYPATEIDSFFYLLFEQQLNLDRIEVALRPEMELPTETLVSFEQALHRLSTGEPIQYILGETEFYGLSFLVNKHTLIPRPETEELVSWVLETVPEVACNILDIGTGSGCIAIALKKERPLANLQALDSSENALAMAKKNAENHQLSIEFIHKNILQTSSLEGVYDVIVSNPPYVRNLEKSAMHKNVLDFEPPSALFVADDNPLVFYQKIATLAQNHLTPNGFLFFEINEYLANELRALLQNLGYNQVQVKKDIFGKNRMIRASF